MHAYVLNHQQYISGAVFFEGATEGIITPLAQKFKWLFFRGELGGQGMEGKIPLMRQYVRTYIIISCYFRPEKSLERLEKLQKEKQNHPNQEQIVFLYCFQTGKAKYKQTK
eukprot:TRINITY_DN8605_c2_g1_i1.p11 TRINITY_DN8605_c2_g1~~TRINITY_DN8605_c2_g1_i1.p11  ORF type:complete len:111 (+),score=1.81 TRINITY_DN8605_c2_g1_i1:1426-1758(+)